MQSNLNIVLFEPEIPPNCGNIIRLAANTNCNLHLIEPLGFDISTKSLRRAGLDYHEHTNIAIHKNFQDFLDTTEPKRLFACSTKGKTSYSSVEYQQRDFLLFGPETRGLPQEIILHEKISDIIRIPMHKSSRSLNLANSVSIILYEALRQLEFPKMQ